MAALSDTQWTSALEGQLLHQINQLAPEARNDLYAAIKQHILAYEDPVSLLVFRYPIIPDGSLII